MIKGKFDLVALVLVVGGLALIFGAVADLVAPQYVVYAIIAAVALPPLLSGWVHLSLNGRETSANIHNTERANEALYYANLEKWRRLDGAGQKADAAPTGPTPEELAGYRRDWQEAAHRFVQWGAVYGFQIRPMAEDGRPGKCIAWHDWGRMVAVLKAGGVLTGLGQNTRWTDGMTLKKWDEVRDDLNYPPTPAPQVAIPLVGGVATAATAPSEGVAESGAVAATGRAVAGE